MQSFTLFTEHKQVNSDSTIIGINARTHTQILQRWLSAVKDACSFAPSVLINHFGRLE